MLFAFLIESFIKKTKRLKLVEVVFLLKEITNLEMDLRFEAAAANEYAENTKNDVGFRVPKIYWNYTSENVMTLDWVDGISIRETKELKKRNLNTEKIANDIIEGIEDGEIYSIELSRELAIKKAIDEAAQGDVILIAGKGHESYQEIYGHKEPFNDLATVEQYISTISRG